MAAPTVEQGKLGFTLAETLLLSYLNCGTHYLVYSSIYGFRAFMLCWVLGSIAGKEQTATCTWNIFYISATNQMPQAMSHRVVIIQHSLTLDRAKGTSLLRYATITNGIYQLPGTDAAVL